MPENNTEAIIRQAMAHAADDGGSDGGSESDAGADAGAAEAAFGAGGDAGSDAGSGDSGGDASGGSASGAEYTQHVTGTDSGDESSGGDAGSAAAGPDAGADAKRTADPLHDALVKELAEFGIHAPKPGQKENRLPYSRMVKIFGNAKKKWEAGQVGTLQAKDQQLSSQTERLKAYEAADRLIETDPDRYIRTLAVLKPEKYGKFVAGAGAATPAAAPAGGGQPAAKDAPPMPGPDVRYNDGSVGYSPEQLQKRDEWLMDRAAERAEAKVKAEYEARFGPMERNFHAQALISQNLPRIQSRLKDMRERWGDLFTSDEAQGEKSEVLTYMRQTGVPLEVACTHILMPKLRKQSDDAEQRGREKAMKELQKRPAAAETAPGGGKKPVQKAGPRSTEEVIRDSMRQAGMV